MARFGAWQVMGPAALPLRLPVVPSFPSAYRHSAMQTATTYGTTSATNTCTITVAAEFLLMAVSSLCPTGIQEFDRSPRGLESLAFHTQ